MGPYGYIDSGAVGAMTAPLMGIVGRANSSTGAAALLGISPSGDVALFGVAGTGVGMAGNLTGPMVVLMRPSCSGASSKRTIIDGCRPIGYIDRVTESICPRDATVLTPTVDVFGAQSSGDVCQKCTGVLASWDQAQKFFSSLGLSLVDLQTMVRHAQESAKAGSPLACTGCGKGSMKPLVHRGIELNLCDACGATWFDRGELQRISGGGLGKDLAQSERAVEGETSTVVGVYEMWWDCGYCDTKALLGKSNRFCPHCGAQQDASRRYFPPAGQEAAANHHYDGVDRQCPACQAPNGAQSSHCRHCGSPLDGSVQVMRAADRSSAAPIAGAVHKSKVSKWVWVVGGVVLALLSTCLLSFFWTRDVPVTVTGHAWERIIDIETLTAVRDDAWCDSMPAGAYGVSHSREQRSTKKIADGETCTTRDVDRGDGTFERKQECRTKYREEPVYDDRCHFTIDRWKVSRSARASGVGQTPAPVWPSVSVAGGRNLGAEREGARRETYTLALTGADAKAYACTVTASKWASVADGVQKTIPVGVMTGNPQCDTL
jgi:hypothetical protein